MATVEVRDIRETLNAVFRDVFEDESITIQDEMTAKDVEGWDSLNHVTLIYAIEKKFGVSFSTKEVQSLNNVGDLIRLIEGKLQ